jgi:hypothetical protein
MSAPTLTTQVMQYKSPPIPFCHLHFSPSLSPSLLSPLVLTKHTHIRTHTGDGKVPSSVANDLLMMCDDIGMGRVQRPDLVGKPSKAKPSTI